MLYHATIMPPGKLVLIIGPSGVGKSVILKTLRDRHPEFVFPRSATTRERRPGEGDELYRFVSEEEFSLWLSEGKFLETAQVHHGGHYGTLLEEIIPQIDQGKTVVREVDVQGFESIRKTPSFSKNGPYKLQTIFILPESEEQLVRHIQGRAPMAGEELGRRLKSMHRELGAAKNTDAQVVNREGGLEETVHEVEELILRESTVDNK
jgi:guanylate kinase